VAQVTPDFDGGCNQRRRRRASRADERKLRARPNHRSSPSTRHLAKRGNKRRRANGGERDGRTLRGAEEEDEDDGGGKDEGGGARTRTSTATLRWTRYWTEESIQGAAPRPPGKRLNIVSVLCTVPLPPFLDV
jgi:hypothetical protein